MNPEIKERWIAALESGDYPKTKGVLKDEEGYCCLGVLCEIAIQDGVIKKIPPNNRQNYMSKVGAFLPRKVAKWAGIKDVSHPKSDPDSSEQGKLAAHNDLSEDFSTVIQVIKDEL